MKVIRGVNKIVRFKKAVVALGVFDGVHAGHRKILKAAVRKARLINGTSAVLTFWPHPQKEESLYSLEHRLRLIGELGVDACMVINFNKKFSRMAAQDFVKNILVKRIGAYYIYVGRNFRFGKNARGDYRVLSALSRLHNFKLRIFKVAKAGNRAISSTYIRKLIKQGKLADAAKLLMRPVSILGTVMKGDSLGGALGFPTANINPHHEVIPPDGVYEAAATLGKRRLRGICYIGTRPTLTAGKGVRVEIHLFDFKKNIYGRYLEIQFIRKIRDDIKFNSIPALAAQIRTDVVNLNS